MPPKKGGKKDDKKKKDAPDEPEYDGPNIYDELLTKPVTELEVNLDAPIQVINKENIEFDVLTDRLQSVCARLEIDNQRL